MIIKLNEDKYLQTTKKDTIIQGEHNVNDIIFYIPISLLNEDIYQTTVTATFILPDENTLLNKPLKNIESEYADYLKYSMVIDSDITSYSGFVDVSLEITHDDSFLLKSKHTRFFIDISEFERICHKKYHGCNICCD